MIYELRTRTLTASMGGDGVFEFERRFGAALAADERCSPLLVGSWHTEIGPLSQAVQLWEFDDLAHRATAWAGKAGVWPPDTAEMTASEESSILIPAPFKPTVPRGEFGPFFELRTYRYLPGSMPTVLQRWADGVPYREQFSPLLGLWYTEIGPMNLLFHLWPYRDLNARQKARAAAKGDQWPPHAREFLVSFENKIMLPAPFSPIR